MAVEVDEQHVGFDQQRCRAPSGATSTSEVPVPWRLQVSRSATASAVVQGELRQVEDPPAAPAQHDGADPSAEESRP